MTTGWAVRSFGEIKTETVSPTRRGAIVNWLVVGTPRRMIYAWTTDDEIERHYRECRGSHEDHKVIQVDIMERANGSA